MDVAIQEHLREVVRTLRAGTPDATGRRAALLDVLEAYAEAGRYPQWERPVRRRPRRTRPPRRFDAPGARSPRFRDAQGTWCAVGHLMAATDPALADDIARRFEPCWLDEIDDPRVPAWAAAHGFTPDELAWIQPGYCWQPPVCDEVVVEEVASVDPSGGCDAADPRFQGAAVFCQECDGPFRVWVNVENVGQAATELDVELRDIDGEVFDRVQGVALASKEARQVELTTASVLDLAWGASVWLVPADDCDPTGDELEVLWPGNGAPGWVLPEACGGSCGPAEEGDVDPDDERDGRGCSSTGGVAPWGLLVAAGLLTRRSRRRAHRIP